MAVNELLGKPNEIYEELTWNKIVSHLSSYQMGINFLSQLGMDLDFESRVPGIETPNLSIKN
jgi:hypothetical protein